VRARLGLEQAAADHRAAIDEVVRAIESLDRVAWTVPRQPGKWSPAEIAEHLVLAYEPPLAELDGGPGYAVPVPWWKRTVLRWKVLPQILERGQFPRGAPAPKEARPKGGAASPEEAVRQLRENAGRFEEKLCVAHAARSVRLTHAYFGKLTAPQILKLLAVHAHHHRGQFPT
jgi:uncharacterized damage-inducible protein DinB